MRFAVSLQLLDWLVTFHDNIGLLCESDGARQAISADDHVRAHETISCQWSIRSSHIRCRHFQTDHLHRIATTKCVAVQQTVERSDRQISLNGWSLCL